MNESTDERFQSYYTKRIADFLNEVRGVNAVGIPEVHLPCWGDNYDKTLRKMAFIGIDTNNWGTHMAEFISEANSNPHAALARHLKYRDDFRENFSQYGGPFVDAVLQLLAKFHKVDDWKQLKAENKSEKSKAILQSFVCANANAVVRWEVAKKVAEDKHKTIADHEAWERLKKASEKHLDSIWAILNVFHPDIAIMMNWGEFPEHYWGTTPMPPKHIMNHLDYASVTYDSHTTHIFHTAHPRSGKTGKNVISAIFGEWQTISTNAIAS